MDDDDDGDMVDKDCGDKDHGRWWWGDNDEMVVVVVITVMRVVVFDDGNNDSYVLAERFVCVKFSCHVYYL